MAATVTDAEMTALAMSGTENLVPAAEERSQVTAHKFLSLAPTTSASYPATPRSPTFKSPIQKPVSGADAQVPALPVDVSAEQKARRSSSLGSDGSLTAKRRFLKLGPVHFGEGDGDFSEEVIN